MKSKTQMTTDSVTTFKTWVKNETEIPKKNMSVAIKMVRGLRCYCLETVTASDANDLIALKQDLYKIEVVAPRVLLFFSVDAIKKLKGV